MKKNHTNLFVWVWVHLWGQPIPVRIMIVVSTFVVSAFAIIGAVLTAGSWLPVVLALSVVTGCAYLLYHYFLGQYYKEHERQDSIVRQCLAEVMCLVLTSISDFPIAIFQHVDSTLVYNACRSHEVGRTRITRLQLQITKADQEVTEKQLYLMHMFLQHLVDIYCRKLGLVPVDGQESYFVVTQVVASDMQLFVDFAKPNTVANRRYIEHCKSPEPAKNNPPYHGNPYLYRSVVIEEEPTLEELLKDLTDDDVI